jgi:hypothetical protein
MGEVTKPGEYVIEDRGATVIEGIGMAEVSPASPLRTDDYHPHGKRPRTIITVPVEDITRKGLKSSDITCEQGHHHRSERYSNRCIRSIMTTELNLSR